MIDIYVHISMKIH